MFSVNTLALGLHSTVSREPGKTLNFIFEIPGEEKPGKNYIIDKRSGKAWNFVQPDKN